MSRADGTTPRLSAREEVVDGGTVLLSLVGELDLDTVAAVATHVEHALASRPRQLCIDLQKLGFCDSSGLNFLLRLRARTEDDGVRLTLAAPGDAVRRLLELTGADTVFEIHERTSTAVASR